MSLHQQDNPFSGTALGIYSVTIIFYAVVYMVLMILPFYALSQGQNNSSIGAIMGVTMIASMLTRPFVGRVIDKYGANRIFIIALVVFAFSLLGYFTNTLWIYWLVRLVQGVVAACFSTAMEIITIDLLSRRLRAQGLSLYSLATIVPTTFGPALSLYLKDFVSFEMLFLIFFILGVCNIVFALKLYRYTSLLDEQSKRSEKGSLRYFFQRSPLLISALIMLLASTANGAVFTFLPIFLHSLNSSFAPSYFLIQMMVLVAVRFFGRTLLPSDGTLSTVFVFTLCTFIAFGTWSIYFSQHVFWLACAAIANGIGFALLYPALLTFVSFAVENESRGFYLGLFIGAADLGFALGSLIMGPVADAFSLRIIFLVCATGVLAALPLCLLNPYRPRPHVA